MMVVSLLDTIVTTVANDSYKNSTEVAFDHEAKARTYILPHWVSIISNKWLQAKETRLQNNYMYLCNKNLYCKVPSERPYLCNHPPEFLHLKHGVRQHALCGSTTILPLPCIHPPVDFIVLVLRKGGGGALTVLYGIYSLQKS